MITETDVRDILTRIECGSVFLRKQFPEKLKKWGYLSLHYGNVAFEVSNDWKLVVFFDCGEWKYLDCITSPDGEMLEYDDFSQGLKNYRPPMAVRKVIYGSPGYLGSDLEAG